MNLQRTWFFAKWYAATAFLGSGSVVFYLGYRQFRPPPPPPGTALCGNCIIGGLMVMVVCAPVAAVLASLVAAAIGGLLDYILNDFEA